MPNARIRQFDLKPILEVLECSSCPPPFVPEMKLVNREKKGDTKNYIYRCPTCGSHETHDRRYPRVTYERIYPQYRDY
jgi:Zn finger protein HypA/HybF involved in hydrogenase expression